MLSPPSASVSQDKNKLVYQLRLQRVVAAYLWEHQVQARAVLPATAYIELAAAAVICSGSDSSSALTKAVLQAPLHLPDTGEHEDVVSCQMEIWSTTGAALVLSRTGRLVLVMKPCRMSHWWCVIAQHRLCRVVDLLAYSRCGSVSVSTEHVVHVCRDSQSTTHAGSTGQLLTTFAVHQTG